LSRGKVGHFTAEPLKYECRIGVNGMPDQRAGPSAGCYEVGDLQPSAVRGRKSFRRRRPADVSSANKQYAQTTLRFQPRVGRSVNCNQYRCVSGRSMETGRELTREFEVRTGAQGVGAARARAICRRVSILSPTPLIWQRSSNWLNSSIERCILDAICW